MKLYYDGFGSNLAVQLRLGEGPVLKGILAVDGTHVNEGGT